MDGTEMKIKEHIGLMGSQSINLQDETDKPECKQYQKFRTEMDETEMKIKEQLGVMGPESINLQDETDKPESSATCSKKISPKKGINLKWPPKTTANHVANIVSRYPPEKQEAMKEVLKKMWIANEACKEFLEHINNNYKLLEGYDKVDIDMLILYSDIYRLHDQLNDICKTMIDD